MRRRSDLTSAERKQMPLERGCLQCFPDALMLVSHLSWLANEKHNPGEELHWSKGKSTDHGDCLARHQLDVGDPDEFGLDHAIAVAWRGLSQLQTLAEELGYDGLVRGLDPLVREIKPGSVTIIEGAARDHNVDHVRYIDLEDDDDIFRRSTN